MKLHFLGGADEVGASCLLVEAAGRRILIDAGLRMGDACGDRLPDLARATEVGGIDAICLTHAHLDHSGALPLVHGAFPKADILMTAPTYSLVQVLLLDAVRVMEIKSEAEREIPLYPEAAVEAFLARAKGLGFLEPISLFDGIMRVTFFPAGHVLGAAAVGLETPEGNVLVTGDLSLTDQLTVSGMPRPRFSPHVVVCESTYGNRLHAMRRVQERRLADTVLEAIRLGRKVLIPAFALGRAQEVLLILRRALAQPGAPDMTVYVDGMVRRVCGVYCQHADALSKKLRRRAESDRELFYTADGKIRAVDSPRMRQEILDGPPCVIVSSSGMLAGGPSSAYAKQLAGNERALIAITGYQDEEAPGRRLQEIAAGKRKHLVLDGVNVPVCCRVETYALSAHADAQELAGLVTAMGPKAVALVHGDEAARRGLAERFAEHKLRDVYLPVVGETLEFDFVLTRKRRGKPGMGEGRTLDEAALSVLHQRLWEEGPRGRTYSAGDLAEAWYGTEGIPQDLNAVHDLAASAPSLFRKDPRHAFLYRLIDPEAPAPGDASEKTKAPASNEPQRDEAGRLEQNAALALADTLLGPESGLFRKGADREKWCLKLYFHFPDTARHKQAAAIAELAQNTGWAVELHPHPHMGSLEEKARDILGTSYAPLRTPSVNTNLQQVTVTLPALPSEETSRQVSERFKEETGYTLLLKPANIGTPKAKRIMNADGRMEINALYDYVDLAFSDKDPHLKPLRKSLKRDGHKAWVELSFITPEIGAGVQELIDVLERQTGWPIRIADRVDQQAVMRVLKERIPVGWRLVRGPGLDVPARKVKLRLAEDPPSSEWEALDARLKELTGFDLG